jgi:hypothetical protein
MTQAHTAPGSLTSIARVSTVHCDKAIPAHGMIAFNSPKPIVVGEEQP